jgi:NTE family protein
MFRRLVSIVCAAALGWVRAEEPPAQPPEPPPENIGIIVSGTTPEALYLPNPPRLALVLSGGGARGFAHAGVLKVLEELKVKPDLIVGTSMGSIVGGLYATGWSPEEIAAFAVETDLKSMFSDRVERTDKIFRRRTDDRPFLIPAKLRLKGWKPWIPPGILGAQRIGLLLEGLEATSTGARDFDAFPIPYRAVAADLQTGEAVVLGDGSLATAMRASMSIAGAFAPVELGGRKLVDGGAVANLPVAVAQQLGAQRIIAVDITSPLESTEEAGSFLSVVSQNSGFLTVANRLQDVARLRPGDVYIRPDLGDLTFTSFDRAAEAVAIGEAAARALLEQLRPLATDAATWEAFQAAHHRRPQEETSVDQIVLESTAPVDPAIARRQLEIPAGEPLDPAALSRQVLRLYGLDYYAPIRATFDRDRNWGVLALDLPRKPYGRDALQFGVSFEDDFEGNANYSIAVRHQMIPANRLAGEWRNVLQLGTRSEFSSGFYQPIEAGLHWFVEPEVRFKEINQRIWFDGDPVAEYRVTTADGAVSGGRTLGDWGELRAGLFRSHEKANQSVGFQVFPDEDLTLTGVAARFRVDTQDSTLFPRAGTQVDVRYDHAFSVQGSDEDAMRYAAEVEHSWSFGRNTITAGAEGGVSLNESSTPLGNAFFLGGFRRLSGLGTDELIGSRGGVARLDYYRQLLRLDLGALSSKVYAGLTLEAGNCYSETDPVTWESLRWGGAVYLGAETVLGPAFFSWGYTDPSRKRFYLIVGQRY